VDHWNDIPPLKINYVLDENALTTKRSDMALLHVSSTGKPKIIEDQAKARLCGCCEFRGARYFVVESIEEK
jgi:hypothetical protein